MGPVECGMSETHEVEHVSDDDRVLRGVRDRLVPGEQITRHDPGVRGVVGEQRCTADPRSRPWITDGQPGVEARQRGEDLPAPGRQAPGGHVVSSMLPLVGSTSAISSAAASTARIAVFQPTPKLSRIVLIGLLSRDIGWAARAAARLHTVPDVIDAVRPTNVPHLFSHVSGRWRQTNRGARPATGRWRTVASAVVQRMRSEHPTAGARLDIAA